MVFSAENAGLSVNGVLCKKTMGCQLMVFCAENDGLLIKGHLC